MSDLCYECDWWLTEVQCPRCGQTYRLAPIDPAAPTGTNARTVELVIHIQETP